jgi:hypothetical protein
MQAHRYRNRHQVRITYRGEDDSPRSVRAIAKPETRLEPLYPEHRFPFDPGQYSSASLQQGVASRPLERRGASFWWWTHWPNHSVFGPFVMVLALRRTIFAFCLLAVAGGTAVAVDCPGNPGALGTNRAIVVDPTEHPLIGSQDYRESLPLEDHEIVLTFDDGPAARARRRPKIFLGPIPPRQEQS